MEQVGNPKAIILAGAPGAGKGFILSGLDLGNLKVLNVDNEYINLLKKANVSLDLKNASPEGRSKAAIAMAQANKEFKGKVAATIEGKESFILDGTAASVKQTANLKNELEEAGYDVFMLYVYTDLERSLKQNQDRFEKSDGKDRSLAPAIVLRTWASVTSNFKPYDICRAPAGALQISLKNIWIHLNPQVLNLKRMHKKLEVKKVKQN